MPTLSTSKWVLNMNLELYKNFVFVYIIIAGIVCFCYLKAQRRTYWIIFPCFLVILGLLDGLGIYLAYHDNYKLSQFLYMYLVIPGEIIFYLWLFSKDPSGKPLYYKIGFLVFILSMLFEFLFKEGISGFSFTSLSYLVGNLILLLNILHFFFNLSQSDRILFFYRERMFWISLGLLIFWLGSLPYYGLFNYLNKNYYDLLVTYCWFVMTFNYIMYTLFMVGIVWGKKNS